MRNSSSAILFLDIETVPLIYHFKDLDPQGKRLFELKMKSSIKQSELPVEQLYEKAGIYAEFARVVCIGLAWYGRRGKTKTRKSKLIYGHNEIRLLYQFKNFLREEFPEGAILCAHNGKEFDFPFLARRMLIRGIPLPEELQLQHKKPWEIQHIDTMDWWKFGDYKHFTSLELLAHVFDLESPKHSMSGDQVAKAYWEDGNISGIAAYCRADVQVLMDVYEKLNISSN